MMRVKLRWYALFALTIVLAALLSPQVLASACKPTPYYAYVQLGSESYEFNDYNVTNHLPDGTVLYRQLVTTNQMFEVECTGSAASAQLRYSTVTYRPNISSDIIYSGVPGIGFRFRLPTGEVFSSRRHYISSVALASNQRATIPPNMTSFVLEIVKTGPVPIAGLAFPPNTIPRVIIGIANAGDAKLSNPLVEVAFTGFYSILFTHPGCQTPGDYTFTFPTVNIQDFGERGSATSWLRTPVTLTDCRNFFGTHKAGTDYVVSQYTYYMAPLAESHEMQRTPATVRLRLEPVTAVLDAENGIIDIEKGVGTAHGIGIQLGYKINGSDYRPIRLGQNLNDNAALTVMPEHGYGITSTITYELGARLVKTAGGMAAGKIRAAVVYTIIYL